MLPVVSAAVVVAVAACGSSSGTPPAGATSRSGPTRHVPSAPFNVAVAVPGVPNPNDPSFLADQEHLYDPRQFSDRTLYPPGYHWRIDPGIGPHGVRSAHAALDSESKQWVLVIAFTAAAAQRFGADTEAAYQAIQANPADPPPAAHIAFFIGNEVVSAPYVQSPSSGDTQVNGNFSEQQADDLARAITASAQLS